MGEMQAGSLFKRLGLGGRVVEKGQLRGMLENRA